MDTIELLQDSHRINLRDTEWAYSMRHNNEPYIQRPDTALGEPFALAELRVTRELISKRREGFHVLHNMQLNCSCGTSYKSQLQVNQLHPYYMKHELTDCHIAM